MRLSFPHMGNLYIPIKTFFESLGIEVVVPPLSNKETLELGVKHSPEFACLPLKVNIGNMIQALEKGADTIVMAGGVGPCRFGYYSEVQREILSDLGYDFEMIVLDPPKGNLLKLVKNIKKLIGNNSFRKIWFSAKLAWKKAVLLEELDYADGMARVSKKLNRKEVNNLFGYFEKEIDLTASFDKLQRIENQMHECYHDLIPSFVPIKIGLVGEIYTVLDNFVNLDIKKKLEDMGVYVDKSISLTEWANTNLLLKLLNIHGEKNVEMAARPYLNHFVGGHGLQSVGNTVLYANKNFDGVVHVLPFTCMPEIIAKSILPAVSKKYNIPVLSLVIDEHAADTGLNTRLEAFIDLLCRRKEGIKDEILPGS